MIRVTYWLDANLDEGQNMTISNQEASTSSTASTAGFGSGITELQGKRNFVTLHRDVWAAVWKHKAVFLVMPLLVWLPLDIVVDFVASLSDDFLTSMKIMNKVNNLLSMTIGLAIVGAMTHAVDAYGRGGSIAPFAALKKGASELPALIVPSMIAGFIITGCTLLFIIPGIIATARLSLFVPVVIFEGKRGTDALKRSNELVKKLGTARLAAFGLTTYLAYVGLTAVLPLIYGLVFPEDYGVIDSIVGGVLGAPGNLLMVGIAVGCSMLYNDAVSAETAAEYGKSTARYLWPYGGTLEGFGHKLPVPKAASTVFFALVLLAGVVSLSAFGFVLYEAAVAVQ